MDDYLLSRLLKFKKKPVISDTDTHHEPNRNVIINSAPKDLKREFDELFTQDAIDFMVDLTVQFEDRIERLYSDRLKRKAEFRTKPKVPRFQTLAESDWKVSPKFSKLLNFVSLSPDFSIFLRKRLTTACLKIPAERLKNRRLDLGDVSPSNLPHFSSALRSPVQGIQVDFDDGHCPTWRNQISGLYNVLLAVQSRLPDVPRMSEAPVLVLRPRAWNMIETNMSIAGRHIPGPIFDFSLLIYHTGHTLHSIHSGPAFYLSKIESSKEAKLWNDIFTWTELQLKLPHGSIKACVLIENILAAFEMDLILYELRDHSLGLNCGIWDYAASIISKFGYDKSFLLPDRNKYVDMNKQFLRKYMELVIRVCHKRGAHATGGMVAQLLPHPEHPDFANVLRQICEAKLMEIQSGVDGFMVYDVKLVPYINAMWKNHGGPFPNQISNPGTLDKITEKDLLSLPEGGVTVKGLDHNIKVSVLFNFNWLNGRGHFVLNGSVEDSATAEISRSQIWQWIRHGASIEDGEFVTIGVVRLRATKVLMEILKSLGDRSRDVEKLFTAYDLFLDLVTRRDFPEFVTSFLYDGYMFKKSQSHL